MEDRPKKPTSAQILSETWKSHKPAKQVKPKKKA
jgi:hypothetical protein